MSARISSRPLGGLVTTLLRILTAHFPALARRPRVEIHNDLLRAGKYDEQPRRFTPWEHLLR
jgi:hypothetical protein